MTDQPGTLEPMPPAEEARPPVREVGLRTWMRENLFSTWYNSVLTVVMAALLLWAARRGIRFVFVTGRWDIIRANTITLLVGLFPRDELWRPWAALYTVTFSLGFAFGLTRVATLGPDATAASGGRDALGFAGRRVPGAGALRRAWPVLLLFGVVLTLRPSVRSVVLVVGLVAVAVGSWTSGSRVPRSLVGWMWLVPGAGIAVTFMLLMWFDGVGWDRWGGLLLTMFFATGGILLSFPIGVLLALGRRSMLPAVRLVSVLLIELVRGVPLITLLFMGSFVVGFLLPPGSARPSGVTRALVAFVIFTAAYIAEIVRGGLQSVPRGQYEAGLAVGLSQFKTMRRVVLPQALRAVIPALVGQFISLFKDTSLAAILGLFELLAVAQAITSQGEFLAQGLQAETLVFASFLYWVGAYTMSKESQRLESRLGVGER